MLNNQNSSYEDDIDNVFPYAFGDWDNFDFNYPLYWALCDVQGVDPTTGEPVKRSGRTGLTRSSKDEIIRVPSVPLKRCGNFWLAHLQQAGSRKLILVRLNLL